MRYWLVKSEPSSWSWQNHLAKGTEHWDGVRNYQAANNMKAMALGDRCFFYHSVVEKRIMGVMEVVKLYYPDPGDASGRFGMVDFSALFALPNPVGLDLIKNTPSLSGLPLIRQSRLSVMPIDDESWRILCEMGGLATE